MVTRWGNDSPEFRELSSKMLTTFLLTMRGTPYYYFGDELGMANIKFDNIEDYRDIESINMYQQVVNNKGDVKRFMEARKFQPGITDALLFNGTVRPMRVLQQEIPG